jgi:hypothetical protein
MSFQDSYNALFVFPNALHQFLMRLFQARVVGLHRHRFPQPVVSGDTSTFYDGCIWRCEIREGDRARDEPGITVTVHQIVPVRRELSKTAFLVIST